MKPNMLARIEETYLQVFKIVLLIVLTLALIGSGVMLVWGVWGLSATPTPPSPAKEPAPAQKAKKPVVDVDGFLKEFDKQEAPPPERPAPPAEASPKQEKAEPKTDPLDAMTDVYIAKLWTYFNAYQAKCGVANPTDQATFLQAFPKPTMKKWFQDGGPEFAESQDRFEQALLQSERVIAICKAKSGKAQVFVASLNWHHGQWMTQVAEGERFERSEQERVQRERLMEERRVRLEVLEEESRVAASRAAALTSFWAALIAFGVFMSIALLLIFSKIESNLRELRMPGIDGARV